MKTSAKLFFVFVLSLLLISTGFAAPEPLATHAIQLNYRQADEVIPLLRPFLHPDGIMTGEGYKILVKTSAQNFRDLQQFVAEIDVSQRQLRVSVTVDRELVKLENQAVGKTGKPMDESPPLANMAVKSYATDRRDKATLTQQVQVQEGKWATISTGESIPVGQRTRNPDGTVTESIAYKSVHSGFQVLPRISGERVNLFIRPQLDSQHPQGGGRIQNRSAETTVSGKLNQWILIGGAIEAEINQPGSRVYATGIRTEPHNQLFVKVEVIQ